MIISRSPFRVSLFGGSTDYESFYSRYGSFLIGFTLNQYCYVTTRITPKILPYHTKVSYSKIEIVDDNRDIEHDGVRGVLTLLEMLDHPLEVTHFSDLPSQTGVGSSSSFVTSLIKGLTHSITKYDLARYAIEVERKILGESGGIQDQIWAAYGGLNSIKIHHNGHFVVEPLPVTDGFVQEFLDHSFLIYTGKTRKSYKIAASHDDKKADDSKKHILEIAHQGYEEFKQESISGISQLLHESWLHKKKISRLIASDEVNQMYNLLLDYGMMGGKLLGSGGSGFIFGVAKDKLTKNLIEAHFQDSFVDIGISYLGAELL